MSRRSSTSARWPGQPADRRFGRAHVRWGRAICARAHVRWGQNSPNRNPLREGGAIARRQVGPVVTRGARSGSAAGSPGAPGWPGAAAAPAAASPQAGRSTPFADSRWGATVGARVEARVGSSAESVALAGCPWPWESPRCGPGQPRPPADHRDRPVRVWVPDPAAPAHCAVSVPAFLNGRLLDLPERRILSRITLDLFQSGPCLSTRSL